MNTVPSSPISFRIVSAAAAGMNSSETGYAHSRSSDPGGPNRIRDAAGVRAGVISSHANTPPSSRIFPLLPAECRYALSSIPSRIVQIPKKGKKIRGNGGTLAGIRYASGSAYTSRITARRIRIPFDLLHRRIPPASAAGRSGRNTNANDPYTFQQR